MNAPDANITCPYTGHRKKCIKLFMHCPKYIEVIGMDNQTEEMVHKFGCADSFTHVLQIEATNQMRQCGAAVESFRNEMVEGNTKFLETVGVAAARLEKDVT